MSPDAWAVEQSALLRGLAHALSNRVGTIASAVGMLVAGAPVAAPIVDVLQDEGARLEELLALVRLLGGEGGAEGEEPIHVPDLVRPAVALHAHHPDVRDVPCAIDEQSIGMPALASHAAVTRALLLLLTATKRAADGGAVRAGWAETPEAVVLSLDGGNIAPDALTAAGALLGGSGRVDTTRTGCRIALRRFG